MHGLVVDIDNGLTDPIRCGRCSISAPDGGVACTLLHLALDKFLPRSYRRRASKLMTVRLFVTRWYIVHFKTDNDALFTAESL